MVPSLGDCSGSQIMKTHHVVGGGGVRLHVREWGSNTGPSLLLIHGWSQNHLCWKHQYESALSEEFRIVAFDLRGHGMSEALQGEEHYTRGELWADDVAAIIDRLRIDRPILVGWSYGGFVICDYLRSYGAKNISGINFVAAAVTLNRSALGTLIGPGLTNHAAGATVEDLPTNIRTMRSFVRACVSSPLPADELETIICWNVVVPSRVRAALISRDIDSDDVLRELRVPVLVTQGQEDQVILPAMGQHILDVCPGAITSWFPAVGHAPFLEEPERFNAELAEFARTVGRRSRAAAIGA